MRRRASRCVLGRQRDASARESMRHRTPKGCVDARVDASQDAKGMRRRASRCVLGRQRVASTRESMRLRAPKGCVDARTDTFWDAKGLPKLTPPSPFGGLRNETVIRESIPLWRPTSLGKLSTFIGRQRDASTRESMRLRTPKGCAVSRTDTFWDAKGLPKLNLPFPFGGLQRSENSRRS